MTLAFRVAWVAENFEQLDQTDEFHPLYAVPRRQGAGRVDNPSQYATLYLARSGAAACGEVFGDLQPIPASALVHRGRADVTRCLIRVHLPDTLTLIDYDDAAVLQERGVRPSDVVRRDREATQQLALGDFLRRRQSGARGVAWWSYHHPAWRPLALWSDELDDDRWFADVHAEQVEPLTLDHPELVVAAATLRRDLEPDS